MIATDLIRAGQAHPARPWPRYGLTSQDWRSLVHALPLQPDLRFEALWADQTEVFALFTAPTPLLVSVPVEAGIYAALSPARPGAALFERAIGDLWGHLAADSVDPRPWLDHGAWPVLRPMLDRPVPHAGGPEMPELRPHAVRSGPVRPGIVEPACVAASLGGERIVQVETRLGFAHKGTLALMRGRTPAEAAVLAARLSGAGTVGHSLAFARAAEAALGAELPPRALALREVLAEIERIALHLHDLAEAVAAAGHDPAALLGQREAVLRASRLAFGHRLLMDVVIPGGVARDIDGAGLAAIEGALQGLAPGLDAGFQRRAGRSLARLEARVLGIARSAEAIRAGLRDLPGGAVAGPMAAGGGEGLGRAKGPRGECWHWLRVQAGRITQAFACDPSWLLVPAMEAEAVGAPLADLDLIAAAFGLSVSGMDL